MRSVPAKNPHRFRLIIGGAAFLLALFASIAPLKPPFLDAAASAAAEDGHGVLENPWAIGHGVCRNGYSGPGCSTAACSLMDLEDCSYSVMGILAVLCGVVIAAAFAVALFPEVLAAAGLGALLVEASEGGGLGAELLTEEALEETAETEAAEVTQEANTGPWASSKANQLQVYFDGGGSNLLKGTQNCGFATDETNGVISTITDGGTPDGYVSPNLTWPDLDGPVYGDPNFELPTAIPQEGRFSYFGAMQDQYGAPFQETSMNEIAGQLDAAGDGAQGIVYVSDGTANGEAHAFNAVSWDGQTYFVDGQTNQIWTDPGEVAGYEKFANMKVWFLPTN